MANPSVTYTLTNGTTADATQVTQNFTDIINSMTDGTKSFSIDALTCAGSATLNGAVTLGNGTPDDITVLGSLAGSIPIKTNNSFDIGSATLGLAGVYLGSAGGFTTRVIGGATSSWTLTLPATAGSDGQALTTNGSGVGSWASASGLSVVTKAAADSPYTATSSNDVILCNAVAGAITVNLPAVSGSNRKTFRIKKTDASENAVTIDGASSELIDGAATVTLTEQNESITLVCDGSAWYEI